MLFNLGKLIGEFETDRKMKKPYVNWAQFFNSSTGLMSQLTGWIINVSNAITVPINDVCLSFKAHFELPPSLLFDWRSIDLSGAQEKEGHFHQS